MIASCAFSVNLLRFMALVVVGPWSLVAGLWSRRKRPAGQSKDQRPGTTDAPTSPSCGAVLLRRFSLRERFPVLAFAFRHSRRQLRLDARVEIALVLALADRRHAVALEPEHLSVLRQRRDAEPSRLAGERLHLRLAPENRGCHTHRHFDVQVTALAFEHGVWRQPHAQVQVARLTTPTTLFALAGDPD